MNTEDQIRQLGLHPREVQKREDCPDKLTLACFVDGGLNDVRLEAMLVHLSTCDHCLETVGMASEAWHNTPRREETPASEIARLQNLGHGVLGGKGPGRRLLPLAAAATTVLAIGLSLTLVKSPHPPGSLSPSAPEPQRQVRSLGIGDSPLSLRVHSAETLGDIESLYLAWTPMEQSQYYRVRIVSDEGDLVFQQQVETTSWQAPQDLDLEPGREYFVRVDAFVSRTRSLSSDFLPFTAGGRSQ